MVSILNGSGTAVVTYYYDAWGNLRDTTGTLATTLGTHNPLRYRGYVYDTETGLYYLQSRYYNPTLGRFLNADALVSTGQGLLRNNMFAYCLNNPVNGCDPAGALSRVAFSEFAGSADPYKNCDRGGGWNYIRNHVYAHDRIVGMINGQAQFSQAGENCGLGTYARNGCGVIAIYNATRFYGIDMSLGDISDSFFYSNRMILFGLGGIGPWAFDEFFEQHGIDYIGCTYSEFLNNVSDGDIIVFTVMNNKTDISRGFHTMTALYKNGEYIILNRSNNLTSPYYSNTIIQGNQMWIYGYILR